MTSKLYNFDGTFIKDTDYVRKNFTGISVEFYGSKSYYKKGNLHRTDGPAVEHANGTKEWYADGKLHRFEGPAHEGVDGLKIWLIKGNYHRIDGPAIEWADGAKEWWIDGKQVTKEQCELLHSIMKLKGLL